LLEYILSYAKAHGIKRVTSLESGDDRAAINLEREMGFVARLLCADPIEIGLSKTID
jgi:acetyltransferase